MTAGHLPAITALQALPFEGAMLALEDGTVKTVRGEDGPYLMGPTCSRLMLWQRGQTRQPAQYRVPAQLAGPLTYALALQPCRTPALVEVEQGANATTFTALHNGGYTYTLTVPRPSLLHLDAAGPGQVLLTVAEVRDPAFSHLDLARIFQFSVHSGEPVAARVAALVSNQGAR